MKLPLKLALLASFTGLSSLAPGALYPVQIDQSTWQLEASPFVCRPTHKVPQFGTAVLERGAGRKR